MGMIAGSWAQRTIADGEVTTVKLADGAVTPVKLSFNSFKHIQTVNLTAASTTITLSDIPSSYEILYLFMSLKSNGSSQSNVRLRFDNDSSEAYRWVRIYSDGSTVSTDSMFSSLDTSINLGFINYTHFYLYDVTINNPDGYHKQTSSRFSEMSSPRIGLCGGNYIVGAKATSIVIFIEDGSAFSAGSRAILYGVGE